MPLDVTILDGLDPFEEEKKKKNALTPSPMTDLLDGLKDADPNRDRAGMNVQLTAEADPEQEAKVQQLSRESGWQPELVRDRPVEAKSAVDEGLLDGLAPSVLEHLGADPANAAISKDDYSMLDRVAQGADLFVKSQKELYYAGTRLASDVSASYAQGNAQVNLAPLAFRKHILGEDSAELDEQIAKLKEFQTTAPDEREDLFGYAITAGAEQLPIMADIIGKGAYRAAQGAATGAIVGAVGGAATGPGVAVTTPVSAAAGAVIGFKVGGAEGAFYLEAGLASDEFASIENESGEFLDPDIVKVAAVGVGALNAGLEFIGEMKLLETIPGVKNLSSAAIRNGVKNALKSPTVRRALKEVGKKYAGAVGWEGITEMAQETINILGAELAKNVDTAEFEPIEFGEAIERIGEAGKKAVAASLALGIPGTTIGTVTETRKAKRAQDFNNDQKKLKTLVDETKTQERSKEKMNEFLDRAGVGDEVYVDGATGQVLFQENPEAFAKLGITAEQIAEAEATGQDVAVKLSDLHTELTAEEFNIIIDGVKAGPAALSKLHADKLDTAAELDEAVELFQAGLAEVREFQAENNVLREQLLATGRPVAEVDANLALLEKIVLRLRDEGAAPDFNIARRIRAELVQRLTPVTQATGETIVDQAAQATETQALDAEKVALESDRAALKESLNDAVDEGDTEARDRHSEALGTIQTRLKEIAVRADEIHLGLDALTPAERVSDAESTIEGVERKIQDQESRSDPDRLAVGELKTALAKAKKRLEKAKAEVAEGALDPNGAPITQTVEQTTEQIEQRQLRQDVPAEVQPGLAEDTQTGETVFNVEDAARSLAGTWSIETGLWRDNPGGGWLAHEQKRAKEEGFRGAETAYTRKPVLLPLSDLKDIPGQNDEHVEGPHQRGVEGNFKADQLRDQMTDAGGSLASHPINVWVGYDGKATIAEGNNRMAVALERGMTHAPVVIQYFAGGELADGPFKPETLEETAAPVPEGARTLYQGIESQTPGGKFLRGLAAKTAPLAQVTVAAELDDSAMVGHWDGAETVAEAAAHAEEITYLEPTVNRTKKKDLRWKQKDGMYGNDKMRFPNASYPGGRNTWDVPGCGRSAWARTSGVEVSQACYGGACYAEAITVAKQGKVAGVATGVKVKPLQDKKLREILNDYYKENGLAATQKKWPQFQVKVNDTKNSVNFGKLSIGMVSEEMPAAVVHTNLQAANGQDVRLGVDTDGSAWLANEEVMDAMMTADPRSLSIYSSAYHKPPAPHALSGRTMINVTISGWHPIAETLSRLRWAEEARANGWNVILREVTANPDQFTDEADIYNRLHDALMKTDFMVMQQPLHKGKLHSQPMWGLPGCCKGSEQNPRTCDACEVAEGTGLAFQEYWDIAQEDRKEETLLPDVADSPGRVLEQRIADMSEGVGGWLTETKGFTHPADVTAAINTMYSPNASQNGVLLPNGEILTGAQLQEQYVIDIALELYQGDETQAQQAFDQAKPTGPRGSVTIVGDQYLVKIVEGAANASTLTHELGHIYLEEIRSLIRTGNASPAIAEDWGKIQEWLGVNLTDGITTEHHEQFARAWEQYLMEGKAPTKELESVFERFRTWMTEVYKTVKSLNANLNDDIRGVFDRMLANDQEIEQYAEDIGLKPRTVKEMNALGLEATDKAYLKRVIQGVEDRAKIALEKARNTRRRELTRQWAAEAKTQIEQEQVYQLRALLAEKGGGLDIETLRQDFGDEMVAAVRAKGVTFAQKEGRVPERVAIDAGYENANAMLEDLIDSDTKAERTKQIVAEKQAGYDQTIEPDEPMLDNADLEQYLDDMGRYIGKALGREERLTKVTMRKAARRQLENMPLKDALRIDRFLAAMQREMKNERRATAKGDFEAALTASRKARLNYHMARQVTKLREKTKALEKRAKKLAKNKGTIAPEYLENIKGLLHRYGLSAVIPAEAKPLESLISSDEHFDDAPEFDEWLLNQNDSRSYKDMSVLEIEELTDAIKVLEKAGREKALGDKAQLRSMGVSKEEAVEATTAPMRDLKGQRKIAPSNRMKKAIRWARSYGAGNKMLLFLMRGADGFTNMGPKGKAGANESLLYDTLAEADDNRTMLRNEALTELGKLLDHFKERFGNREYPRTLDTGVVVPENMQAEGLGWTFENVLSVVLNMGTEYNRNAIMEGYGLTADELNTLASSLTKEDLEQVQKIWNLVNSYWPQLAEVYERRYGVRPRKVEANPITINGVELQGGYYPLRFDGRMDNQTQDRDSIEVLKATSSAAFAPAARGGMLKQRRGTGGKPVNLSLNVLSDHLNYVTTYITYAEVIRDVDRVMSSDEYRNEFKRVFGDDFFKDDTSMRKLLKELVGAEHERTGPIDRMIHKGRNMATRYILGANPSVGLKQAFSLPGFINDYGAKTYWGGVNQVMTGPWDAYQNMLKISPAMKERAGKIDRDIETALGADKNKFTKARDAFNFLLIHIIDGMTVLPMWWGAYRQGMEMFDGDQGKASRHADKAVSASQPFNRKLDMAAVQRSKKGSHILFTMFSSFTLKFGNRQWLNTQARRQGKISKGAYIRHLAYERLLPPVLMNMMFAAIWGEEPDIEDIGWSVLLYQFIGLPFFRDLVTAAVSSYRYSRKDEGYKKTVSTPTAVGIDVGQRSVDALANLTADLEDENKRERAAWALFEVFSFVTGVPAAQIARRVDKGMEQIEDDEGGVGPYFGLPAPAGRDK